MKVKFKEIDRGGMDQSIDYKMYVLKEKEEIDHVKDLKEKCIKFEKETGVNVPYQFSMSEYENSFLVDEPAMRRLSKGLGGFDTFKNMVKNETMFELSIEVLG